MKKIALYVFSFLAMATGFGDTFVFDNQTGYPAQNPSSKIAIQWASSLKEVEESNRAVISENSLNPTTFQMITAAGQVTITIPQSTEYFRVLVWSKEGNSPDLLTNWVDVVPNKTYTLTPDRLTPAVLMSGMGC